MKYIDTHTHLYLSDEFGNDSESVVRSAIAAGVERMIFPNVDLSTVDPMISLHTKFPENTFVALGLHPTEVKGNWQDVLEQICPMFEKYSCVAVGEVGIDLYWDKTFRDEQMLALNVQLGWAEALSLPVILHCRDGLNEVLEVIKNYKGNVPQIVFHSFGGNVSDVEKIKSTGDFYFGINGVVTFKNAQNLREALPSIGLDRILLETDSPYLSPVPYRGKRNESSYIPIIAKRIAEVLNISENIVASVTTANAESFFKL